MGVCSVDWCSSARGVRSLSPRSPLLIPRTYFTLCCLTLSHKLSLSLCLQDSFSLYIQFFCVCISNAHGFMAIARHTTQHNTVTEASHPRASINPLGLRENILICLSSRIHCIQILFFFFALARLLCVQTCTKKQKQILNSEVSYFQFLFFFLCR